MKTQSFKDLVVWQKALSGVGPVIPAKAGIQNRRHPGFRIKCGMTTYVIEIDGAVNQGKMDEQ
ncbi:MAG: hypothetical protein U9Q07_13080 [Planctomycetota bacterium]|nr:hypothetical protein [Planctomycetota bacterium]